jgi:hypothetical protein
MPTWCGKQLLLLLPPLPAVRQALRNKLSQSRGLTRFLTYLVWQAAAAAAACPPCSKQALTNKLSQCRGLNAISFTHLVW